MTSCHGSALDCPTAAEKTPKGSSAPLQTSFPAMYLPLPVMTVPPVSPLDLGLTLIYCHTTAPHWNRSGLLDKILDTTLLQLPILTCSAWQD